MKIQTPDGTLLSRNTLSQEFSLVPTVDFDIAVPQPAVMRSVKAALNQYSVAVHHFLFIGPCLSKSCYYLMMIKNTVGKMRYCVNKA